MLIGHISAFKSKENWGKWRKGGMKQGGQKQKGSWRGRRTQTSPGGGGRVIWRPVALSCAVVQCLSQSSTQYLNIHSSACICKMRIYLFLSVWLGRYDAGKSKSGSKEGASKFSAIFTSCISHLLVRCLHGPSVTSKTLRVSAGYLICMLLTLWTHW